MKRRANRHRAPSRHRFRLCHHHLANNLRGRHLQDNASQRRLAMLRTDLPPESPLAIVTGRAGRGRATWGYCSRARRGISGITNNEFSPTPAPPGHGFAYWVSNDAIARVFRAALLASKTAGLALGAFTIPYFSLAIPCSADGDAPPVDPSSGRGYTKTDPVTVAGSGGITAPSTAAWSTTCFHVEQARNRCRPVHRDVVRCDPRHAARRCYPDTTPTIVISS
jgi:hypothetical protein